ncbi:MAG: hypothetical protein C4343_05850 [Chloroflexota bacterium]
MPWRCPHCGTPQREAARCWVCRRSSTSCATCRYFGRAVVAGVGFCLLDRRRRVRRGDELEACWTPSPVVAPRSDPVDCGAGPRTSVPIGRTFVPVLPTPDGEHLPAGPDPNDAGPSTARFGEDELDIGFWSALEGPFSA